MIYQECKAKGGSIKNTGAKEQCLEGLTIRTAVALPDFRFDTIANAKDKTKWDTAIAEKKIFPLYDVEELASANTEDTFFEGRSRKYKTASGKKESTYSSFLGLCSHNALKSFDGKEMQLFEFTEDGAILSVMDIDGVKVKGQNVVLTVGKRVPATSDRPASTPVTISYKDFNEFEDNGAVLRPENWDGMDLYGIFDATITQVSATSTSIKFTVSDGCAGGGDNLSVFEDGDVEVKDGSGAVQSVSFVAPDANGVYEVTGTGFADGFTVGLVDVVTKSGTSYESPNVLTVSGIV